MLPSGKNQRLPWRLSVCSLRTPAPSSILVSTTSLFAGIVVEHLIHGRSLFWGAATVLSGLVAELASLR
jgi:hypothetical protein